MAIVVIGTKDGNKITEIFTVKDENTVVHKSLPTFDSLHVTHGVSDGSNVLVQSEDNLILFNLENKQLT
jgi:hypothetical protein